MTVHHLLDLCDTQTQTDRQAVGQSVSHCQRIPCTCLKLWQIADADSSVVLLSIDVKLGKTAESLYIHSNDKTCRQRFSCTHTHTHTHIHAGTNIGDLAVVILISLSVHSSIARNKIDVCWWTYITKTTSFSIAAMCMYRRVMQKM